MAVIYSAPDFDPVVNGVMLTYAVINKIGASYI